MTSPPSNALNQAIDLFQRGQLEPAATHCIALLQRQPRNFDAVYLLGVIRGNQGRLADAAECFRQAMALDPKSFAAARNLGIALGAMKRFDAAIASFEKALALKPADAQTHIELGVIFAETRRLDQAIASFERAIAAEPRAADAHTNLGAVLMTLGRYDRAIGCFEASLRLRPKDADTHANLGSALARLRQHELAIASFERAVALGPDHAVAHNNLGVSLAALGRHDAAAASFERAIKLQPGYLEARVNLSNALRSLKRYDAALAASEAVLAVAPEDPAALTLAASLKRHVCDWRGLDGIDGRIVDQVRSDRGAILPFVFLTIADDPALQLACARQFWRRKGIAASPAASPRRAPVEGRLKLGYISADFHDHATARLAAQLFERHDRGRFDVFAFSCGPDDQSDMRRRLEKAFDHFLDVRGESDEGLAQRIAEREIDILVDLKGHTEEGRLEVLARRPAPLQAHYLGYPGTLGVDFVDYLLVDRFVAPPEQQRSFTEKLVYLPDSYQVNDRLRSIAEEAPTRAACGLPETGFVFCSFGNSYKITPPIFALWMRLLASVPESVLWLLADNAWAAENLRREAAVQGIDPARLVFAPRLSLAAHLARHAAADLYLDTLPVNAHTTGSDALWAGLPILTCAGNSFVARVAGSLLHAVELPELVTQDLESYEHVALSLAREPRKIAELKRRLKEARSTAPLFDTDRTRRSLEAAYLQMWDIYRCGEAPRSFSVATDSTISATE